MNLYILLHYGAYLSINLDNKVFKSGISLELFYIMPYN